MASAAARSILRSSSIRQAASRLAKSKPKTSTPVSPFLGSSSKPLSQPIFRRPVEMSFAVESMLPYHTATASALMTSMLSICRRSYGWTPEACKDDV
uniref:Uncharacterized protein MANES_13G142700 n=1 Tax=Rhizophora mucronata TaxID=61149 RepID=A0A2P2JP66_RHIMU